MGKVRVCGATCHHAKGHVCRCWCGGMFHGRGNEVIRDLFAMTFQVDKLPTTEAAFRELTGQPELFVEGGLGAGDEWRERLEANRSRERS